MVIEERVIRDIPVLVGFDPSDAPRPLVILSHGFTRSKEDWRDRIPALAARGFFVAALDNRGHGNRSGPDFRVRAERDGRWEVLAIRQMIAETAEDIRIVIDGILAAERVDRKRIGLAGVSMGAFASLKALILDPRIKTAVSNIGSPYWDDVFPGTIEEIDMERRRHLEEFASARQPGSFPERFFPRAVLFQTGELDPHLDSLRVRDFTQRLGGMYSAEPGRVRSIAYPGIAHDFTPAMWENTLEWLDRYL